MTLTTGDRRHHQVGVIMGLIALTLMSGCTSFSDYVHQGFKVGPNYSPPKSFISERWLDADQPALKGSPRNNEAWWTVFNDPILNHVIEISYRQNLTLRQAVWRVAQARDDRNIVAGTLFPQTQQLFGDYSRNQLSDNFKNQNLVNRVFDQWDLGPRLSWELDFWGQFRRAIEAADAGLDASKDSYRNVLVLLQAEVATVYVNIRTADQRLIYARRNLAIQNSSLEIARKRFDNGTTTEIDVSQAIANVAQTEALIPPLEITRRQAANRLCHLIGLPPQDVDAIIGGLHPIPTAPPEVAIGIPADLLRQRPDVRQAERDVAAQSAKIGVATAELYPHISIGGAIFFEANNFSNLFAGKSLAGNVGPSFQWDVLNYGRLANAVRSQEALFQQLAYQYQNTVLQANQEAEDALVAFLKSQQTVKSLRRSTEAYSKSVQLAMTQYREGLTDFNRVFTLQELLTTQQDALAVAEAQVPESLIVLYKALGGGWEATPEQLSGETPSADEDNGDDDAAKAGTDHSKPTEGEIQTGGPPTPTASPAIASPSPTEGEIHTGGPPTPTASLTIASSSPVVSLASSSPSPAISHRRARQQVVPGQPDIGPMKLHPLPTIELPDITPHNGVVSQSLDQKLTGGQAPRKKATDGKVIIPKPRQAAVNPYKDQPVGQESKRTLSVGADFAIAGNGSAPGVK